VNQLNLFLPCAAGVEEMLCAEVLRVTSITHDEANPSVFIQRGGVSVKGSWRDALLLNLWSRLAQRVLVELSHTPYREERDLYDATSAVAWEIWFTPKETFKIDITAQHCPLKSLNFAALTIKDAVADRFRHKKGERPSVDTHWPHARIHAHLSATELTIYIDTSGEPLFKRGWREDKGEAPLKETLAAAMIAASGWDPIANPDVPLYDPCCGSGTIAIEAAQMAMRIAPGISRRFGFEKLLPYQPHVWDAIKNTAAYDQLTLTSGQNIQIFGSDVAHRMVDFAQRNAERAGVADCIEFRGGDALQRLPPTEVCGVMLVNPPYGDRIDVAGIAGAHRNVAGAQHPAGNANGDPLGNGELEEDFFVQLARHWKQHFNGWQAWVLAPDMKLPGRMRLKESRRVPMWNGPIECRLFKFDIAKPAPRVAK
jgi:putative N6-adenine-specific DNA methylase